MALTAQQAQDIVDVLYDTQEALTAVQMASALPNHPEVRKLDRWLRDLVDAGCLDIDETVLPPRFRLHSLGRVAPVTSSTSNGEPPPEPLAPTPASSAPPPPRSAPTPASSTPPPASLALPPARAAATPPGAPSTAPIEGPADALPDSTIDPDFGPMFDLAVPTIVGFGFNRLATRMALQQQAVRNAKAGPAMSEYVAYAMTRFDRMTPSEAEAYYLAPDQYDAWRTKYGL